MRMKEIVRKSEYKRKLKSKIYINKLSQIMTEQFLPSKFHTLQSAEFTAMLEPFPGTQLIYEQFRDCGAGFTKVYPPNSTVFVNNTCASGSITIAGEVTKLIVERNDGWLKLDGNGVHTNEVVIKQSTGHLIVHNDLDRMEIQSHSGSTSVYGDISEHIDVKVGGGKLMLNGSTSTYDVWVGYGCLELQCKFGCSTNWGPYINTNACFNPASFFTFYPI